MPGTLVHWVIPAPHAVRFVSHVNGSVDIEFEDGREAEVYEFLRNHLDFHHSQAQIKLRAEIDERNRLTEIQHAMAAKRAAISPSSGSAEVLEEKRDLPDQTFIGKVDAEPRDIVGYSGNGEPIYRNP